MKICNCRKKLQKLCQEIYEKVSRNLGSGFVDYIVTGTSVY